MKKTKQSTAIILTLVLLLGFVVCESSIVSATASHTQAEAVAWAESQVGKSLDYDGAYGAQCVDLIAYYYQYLGTTTPGGNAYQYCTNSLPTGWKRITNYNGYTPNPGDICVWGSNAGGNGKYGHVAIVVSGNSSSIKTVDQNYLENRKTDYHSWTTSQVTCFIRPDFKAPVPIISPKQCVSDGDYHIVSALNNSYGLNIAYNSTAACANVQLQNNMGDDNLTSLVTVKHIGSGYYTMTFKNSGKNLDVYNANKTSGTNVWQYDANNNDAQKWIIAPSGDGYFYIITKLNTNLYLDVSGGKAASAANIQVYTGNKSNAQKWKFLASGAPTGQTVKDGEYTISSALNSYCGLNVASGSTDNGANIHLWNNMGLNNTNTAIKVKHLGNGLYSLIFKKSNKSLDVGTGYNLSGSNVQQWSYAGNRNQKWIIKSAGNGYYYIISHVSGLALDAYNGKYDNGTNIDVFIWNKSNAQKWKFNPVPYNISYNANGGKLYDDTVSSVKPNGLNTSRGDKQVIVYTRIFGASTTTNQYGDEYSFDKNGKKVGSRLYGSTSGLAIPSGGAVISKHANAPFDLYNIGKKAQYAYFNFNSGYVYFYNNEHDYKIGSKTASLGSTYGTLATPTRDGYTFDGWYTSATGGTKITSSTAFTGTTTLYAHWTKIEEPTTVPATSIAPTTEKPFITETTEPITETAPTITGDVTRDGGLDVRDSTAIKRSIAKIITLSDEQMVIADVNKDGGVDVRDATLIQRAIARITEL